MEITHALIAIKRDPENEKMAKILHFCGFEQEPTQEDVDSLLNELKTDPEFGLVGKMDGVAIAKAPEAIIRQVMDANPEGRLDIPD